MATAAATSPAPPATGVPTPWARALIDACRAMVSDPGLMAEYEEWRRGRSCATPSSPLGASRSGACSSGSAGPVGGDEVMDLVRDSRGRWCVPVPAEPFGYGSAGRTRVLRAIEGLGPRATRAEAEEAARAAAREGRGPWERR